MPKRSVGRLCRETKPSGGAGFDPDAATPEERVRHASLFFGDLLHAKVREFNPKYKEAEGALIGELQRLHSDIYGNRDFLSYLRNQRTFFSSDDNRELDLVLIDYGDLARSQKDWRNRYEVTEEFSVRNELSLSKGWLG